jgi:hypothetical protein
MIDFVMRYGERLAFMVGEFAKPILYVSSDGEKLSFGEKFEAISAIAGTGMESKLREVNSGDERYTYKVKYVANGSSLRFSVPGSDGRTGVYVDVDDEKYRIVGGAEIVKEIVGTNLQARLEKDDFPDD